MKRTFKDRLAALGLSYQKEMVIISLLVLVVIAIPVVAILVFNQLMIGLIGGAMGLVALYFYISRYSSLEKKQKKDHVDNFIAVLSYFEIFISNGNNVYNSFKMLLPYCDLFLQDAITSMLNQIDVDKTVGPYINFASKFDNRIIESLMLSIYQMVDNGENTVELNEFDILFNNIKEKYKEDLIDSKKKSLSIFDSFPLIGAAAITIVLSLSIISVIGDYVNVI